MYEPWMALLILAAAGMLIIPVGVFASWLEKRAARKRGHPWPAE